MPLPFARALHRAGRRSLIWLLVLAFVVYGHSASLVQVLGPAHRHELPVAGASAGLLDRVEAVFGQVRAWRAELHQRWLPQAPAHRHADGVLHVHGPDTDAVHPGAGPAHPHSHAAYQRHHHSAGDPTVLALDGLDGDSAADAAAQANAGSANLPLALAPGWTLPRAGARVVTWVIPAAERWRDAVLRRAERPPRA